MSDILVNNKLGHEKSILFLNQERIIGAQTLSLNQNFGLAPVSYAGIQSNTIRFSQQSEPSCSVSINSFLLNQDYYYSHFTGAELFNGYILREINDGDTCYSLLSGYFTDYSCSYSIGNIPSITVKKATSRPPLKTLTSRS